MNSQSAIRVLRAERKRPDAFEGVLLKAPTEDLGLVLAALPYFRIESQHDWQSATKMLATLDLHIAELTDEQRRMMRELSAEIDRKRAAWGAAGAADMRCPRL